MAGQRVAPGDRAGDSEVGSSGALNDASSMGQDAEVAFAAVISKVMALVPPAEPGGVGSTWVERRTDEFDMKSAYGSGR